MPRKDVAHRTGQEKNSGLQILIYRRKGKLNRLCNIVLKDIVQDG